MKRLAVLLVALVLSATAHATLIDRGDGLIYDDTLGITWMQDANSAAWTGVDVDGVASTLTWDDAVAWADALVFAGFDDWRLPTTLQPDPSCDRQNTDGSSGLNCTGSEMGHLFNVDGISAISQGPFLNIQTFSYWSGTENTPARGWYIAFATDGFQGSVPKNQELHAWAVRDGDIQVPEPSTLALLAAGLLGLAYRRRVTNLTQSQSCESLAFGRGFFFPGGRTNALDR